jgi:hypothetical protein
MANANENLNFKITQGDTFDLEITYEDINGAPINLTGYTFVLEVRDKPGGSILCATCTLGDGILVNAPATGFISVSISSEKTKKFNLPKSAYQLQAILGNSRTTLAQGWFEVNAGVIN